MLCRFPLESRGRTKKMHEVCPMIPNAILPCVCRCMHDALYAARDTFTPPAALSMLIWASVSQIVHLLRNLQSIMSCVLSL